MLNNCEFSSKCGGCDFLDLDNESYQDTKKQILNEQELTADNWLWAGPNTRRKITLQINSNNECGFFEKKSKNIVKISNCYVTEEKISNLIPQIQKFLNRIERKLFNKITITAFDNGIELNFIGNKELDFEQNQKLTNFAKTHDINVIYNQDPILIHRKNQIFYSDFKISLDSGTFIQATNFALREIIKLCREEIEDKPRIIDLYAGFGAYSFGIKDLATGIMAIEGDEKMTKSIQENGLRAKTQDLYSNPITQRELKNFDLAIINPPRNGASPQIEEIAKSNLNKIIYVSCNPKSFKRDLELLHNFKLEKLIAIDQFHGTKHIELVAILKKRI